MSCQDHFGSIDDESGGSWSCTSSDETAASVSVSWNEFQSFGLAARTNEPRAWGHWENRSWSIWSPGLGPFDDLMMPASIFDVSTTAILDDDSDLPKVFASNQNRFMTPVRIETEFGTELGSARSPMGRLPQTRAIVSGKSLEQTSSICRAKVPAQLQQSTTFPSSSRLPVIHISSEENVFNVDPNLRLPHFSTNVPPFIIQDEPQPLISQGVDSYVQQEDVVSLENGVNSIRSESAPYLHSTECARMQCSIIPAMPVPVVGEVSFKHPIDPLLLLAIFNISSRSRALHPPLDCELPLASKCGPPMNASNLGFADTDLAAGTSGVTSSLETSYCSRNCPQWRESSSLIVKPALPAGVPSTSRARNFGLVDCKTYSCVVRDKTWKDFPRDSVPSRWKRSRKPVHRRRLGKPGDSPLHLYRYCPSPSCTSLPLHDLSNLFYLDIAIEEDVYFRYMGRIVIKTIPQLAPRMSENFAILCERRARSYRGCSVFQCWVGQSILTGDTSGRHGRGGQGAYGGNFLPDQNELMPFQGAVAMRRYRKGFSCQGHVGSQFRIFLTRHLNMGGIFGVVVSGLNVAHALGNLGDREGRPTRNAIIAECGRLDAE